MHPTYRKMSLLFFLAPDDQTNRSITLCLATTACLLSRAGMSWRKECWVLGRCLTIWNLFEHNHACVVMQHNNVVTTLLCCSCHIDPPSLGTRAVKYREITHPGHPPCLDKCIQHQLSNIYAAEENIFDWARVQLAEHLKCGHETWIMIQESRDIIVSRMR